MAIIRPSSDIVTEWTPSTGTSLYQTIDETTASDTDYISSNTAGQIARMGLQTTTDPGNDNNHKLSYRASTDDARGAKVRVVETGSFPGIVTSKQPWRSQPQVPVGIDWSNPITQSLRFATIPSHPGYVVTGIKFPTVYSGATKTPQGVITNGTSGYVTYTQEPNVNYNSSTLLAITTPYAVSASGYAGIVHHGYNTDTSSRPALRLVLYTDGKIYGQTQTSNGMYTTTSSSPSFVNTKICAITSRNIGSAVIYANGIFYGSVVYSPDATDNGSSKIVQIGRQPASYAYWYYNGLTELVILWNRYLTVQETLSISANPYQIFRPLTRTFYFDLGRKVIAERTPTLTGSPADYSIDLTSGEAALITDYTALALEVEST